MLQKIDLIILSDWYANNNHESDCVNNLSFGMSCCTGLELLNHNSLRNKYSVSLTNKECKSHILIFVHIY